MAIFRLKMILYKAHLPILPKDILKGIIKKEDAYPPIPMEYMKIGDYIMVQTDYSYRDFEKNSEL